MNLNGLHVSASADNVWYFYTGLAGGIFGAGVCCGLYFHYGSGRDNFDGNKNDIVLSFDLNPSYDSSFWKDALMQKFHLSIKAEL
jgi:hypothetical protein